MVARELGGLWCVTAVEVYEFSPVGIFLVPRDFFSGVLSTRLYMHPMLARASVAEAI